MSDPDGPDAASGPAARRTTPGRARPAGEAAWERRRRLDAAFGEVLPDSTTDDRDPRTGREDDGDEWLLSQVPPHH